MNTSIWCLQAAAYLLPPNNKLKRTHLVPFSHHSPLLFTHRYNPQTFHLSQIYTYNDIPYIYTPSFWYGGMALSCSWLCHLILLNTNPSFLSSLKFKNGKKLWNSENGSFQRRRFEFVVSAQLTNHFSATVGLDSKVVFLVSLTFNFNYTFLNLSGSQ